MTENVDSNVYDEKVEKTSCTGLHFTSGGNVKCFHLFNLLEVKAVGLYDDHSSTTLFKVVLVDSRSWHLMTFEII